MSDPSWAPTNETAEQIWIEEANIDGIVIEGVGYGVHLTLFFLCFDLLWQMRKRQPKYAYSFLAYITVMVICGSIGAGTSFKINQEAFVNQRNFPGGPGAYNIEEYGVTYNVVGTGTYMVNTWLQDGLLLYRFYVLWSSYWWLLVVPMLAFLLSIIMSLLLLAQLAQPGATLWQSSSVNFALGYWCTSIATTLLLTVLIVGRLMYSRYHIRKIIGRQHQAVYLTASAMLIESAALYAIFALVFIITYAKGSSVNYLLFGPLGQVQSIAPLLIILRVAQGRAATKGEVDKTLATLTTSRGMPKFSSTRRSGITVEVSTLRDAVDSRDDHTKVDSYQLRSISDGNHGIVHPHSDSSMEVGLNKLDPVSPLSSFGQRD